MNQRFRRSLVWFRRDLRLEDHAALSQALQQSAAVYCVFVFDRDILDDLPAADRRVDFIHASVCELATALRAAGGGLICRHDIATSAIPALAAELDVDAVFCNFDDEPAALQRDRAVEQALNHAGRAFCSFKDHLLLARAEVMSGAGRPYSVYTPYRRAWLARLTPADLQPHAVAPYLAALAPLPPADPPPLTSLGFQPTDLPSLGIQPGMSGAAARLADFLPRIAQYREARNYPGAKGPSYLAPHLRFGTISIRSLAAAALRDGSDGAQCWLDELIWRDFYAMILYHHPQVVTADFKPEYAALAWRNDPAGFAAWCAGATGYPIVDAAMRQLNQTGYMHNRLRMITASFLTKDLLIDWRLGADYFAQHLLDFDLASNNGGWQWAASTGCDAQPYFRIFNPVTQSEKFDPVGRFIRRYLPELARCPDDHLHAPWTLPAARQAQLDIRIGINYPAPIVDHAAARQRALQAYQAVRTPA